MEGQRALVVVTDERGQPTGLIQLRQLRAAVHAGASGHPGEMMITLSDLPHVDRETTVLDAALFLERTGQLGYGLRSRLRKIARGVAGRVAGDSGLMQTAGSRAQVDVTAAIYKKLPIAYCLLPYQPASPPAR